MIPNTQESCAVLNSSHPNEHFERRASRHQPSPAAMPATCKWPQTGRCDFMKKSRKSMKKSRKSRKVEKKSRKSYKLDCRKKANKVKQVCKNKKSNK